MAEDCAVYVCSIVKERHGQITGQVVTAQYEFEFSIAERILIKFEPRGDPGEHLPDYVVVRPGLRVVQGAQGSWVRARPVLLLTHDTFAHSPI